MELQHSTLYAEYAQIPMFTMFIVLSWLRVCQNCIQHISVY